MTAQPVLQFVPPGPIREAPRVADLGDVEELGSSLPTTFLACRDLTHNYLPFGGGRYRSGGFRRTLRCSRCKTVKHQEMDSGARITRTHYEYPEGYLTKGLGRVDSEGRAVLRLASMSRTNIADEYIEEGED